MKGASKEYDNQRNLGASRSFTNGNHLELFQYLDLHLGHILGSSLALLSHEWPHRSQRYLIDWTIPIFLNTWGFVINLPYKYDNTYLIRK